MKSFRDIAEEIVADHRDDKGAPFRIAADYNRTVAQLHGGGRRDYPALLGVVKTGKVSHFQPTGYSIDPNAKSITFDEHAQLGEYADRMPNIKLGPNAHERVDRVRRHTPVLNFSDNGMPHDLADLVRSHVPDIDSYHGLARPGGTTAAEDHAAGRPMALYHGTSIKKAAQIVRDGLHPNKRGTTYTDLVPNYSEHNAYLATSPSEASRYATREAINDRSGAAILKIHLPVADHHKLTPDEDNLNWWQPTVSQAARDEFHAKHPQLQGDWTHFGRHDHAGGRVALNDNLIPAGHDPEVYRRQVYRDAMKAWTSDLHLDRGSVAHRGSISPDKIDLHKTWKIVSTAKDPSPDEYMDAYRRMQASLIHHEDT